MKRQTALAVQYLPVGRARRAGGRVIWILAWSLIWIGVGALGAGGRRMMMGALGEIELEDLPMALGAVIGGVLAIAIGKGLRSIGKGLMALTAAERLCIDPRPRILFLRSFLRDNERLPRARGAGLHRNHITGLSLIGKVIDIEKSLEEGIVDEFEQIGPVITLGRPGEMIPPTGAARAYVGYRDWKTEIASIAQNAAIILLMVDRSESLRWELGHMAANLGTARMVLILPRERSRRWWEGWSALRQEFPILPEVSPDTVAITYDNAGRARRFRARLAATRISDERKLTNEVAPAASAAVDHGTAEYLAAVRRAAEAVAPIALTPVQSRGGVAGSGDRHRRDHLS